MDYLRLIALLKFFDAGDERVKFRRCLCLRLETAVRAPLEPEFATISSSEPCRKERPDYQPHILAFDQVYNELPQKQGMGTGRLLKFDDCRDVEARPCTAFMKP